MKNNSEKTYYLLRNKIGDNYPLEGIIGVSGEKRNLVLK